MKKFGFILLVAFTAFCFAGTAIAADTVRLQSITTGAAQVEFPLVYSTIDSAASAYAVTNEYALGTWTATGTSVFAISADRTNTAGTEMAAIELTDLALQDLTGVTPVGGPQLLSGATSSMVVMVIAGAGSGVGDTTTAGATLYRIDGGVNGGVELEVGVPFNGYTISQADEIPGGVLSDALTGNTTYCLAPVTIDWEEAYSAASVYGVSGTTLAGSTGVSVWRRSSADFGCNATTGTTVFNQASGVSTVFAAPVISGNSLFIVGTYWTAAGPSGISLFQFDKRDLLAAPIGADAMACGAALNSANIVPPAGLATTNQGVGQLTPTPCVVTSSSGGTIFVVDWSGGVSGYDIQDCDQLFGYDTDFAVISTAGVTASPVTDGSKVLISWTSSVSCFEVVNCSNGSGVSKVWEYDFGTAAYRYQLWSTPALSNGYAYVTVMDTGSSNDTAIWRFKMSDTYDGDPAVVASRAEMFASPIVVGDKLWFCTYNPTVERLADTGFAYGENYWAQFKFDAAKTGHNTKVEDEPTVIPGDSGGCFISTIQ